MDTKLAQLPEYIPSPIQSILCRHAAVVHPGLLLRGVLFYIVLSVCMYIRFFSFFPEGYVFSSCVVDSRSEQWSAGGGGLHVCVACDRVNESHYFCSLDWHCWPTWFSSLDFRRPMVSLRLTMYRFSYVRCVICLKFRSFRIVQVP